MPTSSEADRFLAVIPARGGSKRLPRKNVLPLRGKPLIAWTVEAALACPRLSEVMVTTDDAEIAEAARVAGARVPFIRPHELASDYASSFDVLRHTVEWYRSRNRAFEFLVLLQPTSPLRTATDIGGALDLLDAKRADAVVSVCEMEHSPLWSNTLPADLSMKGFLREEAKQARSQDLAPYYRINGAIYVCRIQRMLSEGTLFLADNIFAYVMPRDHSIDIDEPLDFRLAEAVAEQA